MKTTRFASIAFAILLSFGIHFLISWDIFNHTIQFDFFLRSALMTGVHFILALVAVGFFILEPLRQEKETKNIKTFTNWWWHIYLSVWILMVIIFIEYSVINSFPIFFKNPIRKGFVEYPSILFLIKGFLLIPAHIKNLKLVDSSKRVKLSTAFIIELFLIFMAFLILKAMSDSVPEFGD